MVLKTITKRKYDDESTTESHTYLETNYYSDISYVSKNLPLEHTDGKVESMTLHFKDDNEILLVLRTLEDNVWIENYQNVFLMNDKGETIERIV